MEDDKPLINPKDMKVREFDGDRGFSSFIEDTKAYFEVVKPVLAETIEWVEYQPGVLENVGAKFGSNAEKYGRMLHSWMRHKLRGTARTWVKDKEPGQGLQTWRDMLTKYDPSTGASLLDLQQRIRMTSKDIGRGAGHHRQVRIGL